ncbi:MAG: hypothetical protein H0V05_05190, partial [Euzebyaceae bacterium]|nr:hypothetical protein [Euzebyaceae bacterium]
MSTTPHPSFNQEAVATADGGMEACWQGRGGGRFGTFSRRWSDARWSDVELISDDADNVWDPSPEITSSGLPRLAATVDGGLLVAYRVLRRLPLLTSCWEVAAQVLGDGGWGPLHPFEAGDGGVEEVAVTAGLRWSDPGWQADGRRAVALGLPGQPQRGRLLPPSPRRTTATAPATSARTRRASTATPSSTRCEAGARSGRRRATWSSTSASATPSWAVSGATVTRWTSRCTRAATVTWRASTSSATAIVVVVVAPELDLPQGWISVPVRVEWGRNAAATHWSGTLRVERGEVLRTEFWAPEVCGIGPAEVRWTAATQSFGGG